MRRFATLLLLVFVLPACRCGQPPGDLGPDGGDPSGRPCTEDLECALGETCQEGYCAVPSLLDAGPRGCESSADCADDEVCVPSTRVCILRSIEDAGTLDGGQTGTCFEGQSQSCGSSKLGECRLGLSTCTLEGEVWSFGPCQGAVNPATESCNGKDDDCDGQVDDGLGSTSCGVGACARTVDNCVGGQTQSCTQGPSSAEVCDGLDNDCDGTADDGISDLSCGVGACARTVAACLGGAPQLCTPGTPVTESCNGQDDDCDGTADEELGQEVCGLGICVRSVERCVGGQPQPCTPGPSAPEACNGKDDSCDGTVDEGCSCINGQTQSCYTGLAGTEGVGPCHAGTQLCVGGAWGGCLNQVVPSAETCNGVDDDCDNQTDEGLGQKFCGTGACRTSVQACVGGATQVCTPLTAGTESCNGLDDDCDGQTDEGLADLSCGVGACRRVVPACVGGVVQVCQAGTPGLEICNSLDDDCDGQTDETFPQSGQGCATGVPGTCGTGQYTCPLGSLVCTQTVFPVTEVCSNGLDDNCNNLVDDPQFCGCSALIDADFDGSNECLDCNDNDGTIRPGATETCNGKDDNCNNLIDETFDVDGDGFSKCGTVPGGGLDPKRVDCNDNNSFVFPLKMTDCGAAATPTVANGVDDNCNGYVDETCAPCTDGDSDGFTTCQGDCNDKDPKIRPSAAELCDGKDNDCDRRTVDNCGVSDPCGFKQGNSWNRWPTGTDQCRPDLVCVSNVSTGALTCGSFCNQTQGTGLNDSCAVNEGCNKNLIDSDNQHLCSVAATGAKTTGQTCTLDAECRTGDCNTTDGATGYCSDKCTHQAGCSANSTCYLEQGPLNFPPSIYYYYSYCRLTSNITGVKTLGQACTGTECRTGALGCFNNKCTQPCCQNSECGAGYSCSIDGPKTFIGYTNSSGAQIWSAVPSCLPTTSSTRVSGQACAASSECKSGICDKARSICVDVCCNDASCANGTTCEPVNFKFSTGQASYIRACVFSPVPSLVEQK